MTAENDMQLPQGFTCKECCLFKKCVAFGIGSATDDSEVCDWSPSKFRLNLHLFVELRTKCTQLQAELAKITSTKHEMSPDLFARMVHWLHEGESDTLTNEELEDVIGELNSLTYIESTLSKRLEKQEQGLLAAKMIVQQAIDNLATMQFPSHPKDSPLLNLALETIDKVLEQ
jgi:hypothetical protein